MMATAFMIPEPIATAGVALKGGVVLGLAWGVTACMRRGTASVKHLTWTLALMTSLALLAIAPVAPRIPVQVPIAMAANASAAAHAGALTPSRLLAWLRGLSIAWAVGAMCVAAWFAAGHIAFAGCVTSARRGPARRLATAAPWLGEPWRARLAWSDAIGVPLSGGLLRAAVVMPDAARAWPAARLRSALLHEFAHVARRDHLTRLAASAVCTLFWFNPLVWLASRQLRAESERACDDRVIRAGVPPVEYAAHLLEVARDSRAARSAWTAAGMARPFELEFRVRHILSARIERRSSERWVTALVIVASLLVLLALAPLRTQLVARF